MLVFEYRGTRVKDTYSGCPRDGVGNCCGSRYCNGLCCGGGGRDCGCASLRECLDGGWRGSREGSVDDAVAEDVEFMQG